MLLVFFDLKRKKNPTIAIKAYNCKTLPKKSKRKIHKLLKLEQL